MMRVHYCEQGTAEWHALRAGIPTASEFATIMASGKDGGASKTRRSYLLKLAGEVLTGEVADSYSNGHMERGKAMEDAARQLYAFEREAEPDLVGFITNGPKGCSPDSLIDEDGLLEIKTKLPGLLIDCIEKGLKDPSWFPPEHKAQCQGALWVAERDWIDIAVYWPKLPLFVRRAHRDETYIANLAAEVDRFNAELAETVERIRRYGVQAAEAA